MKLYQIMILGCAMVAHSYTNAQTNEQKIYPVHPSKMDEFNARTGGLVYPPKNAKSLLFFDARSENKPVLEKFATHAERMLFISIDVKREALKKNAEPKDVAFKEKEKGAGAVVLMYEKKGDPVLSVFPEDAIVLVNFEPLKCSDANKFSRRFATEFWRSIAFSMGGYAAGSQMGSSLQPIFSVADFDTLKGAGLSPMQIAAINEAKSKLSIFGRNAVPYSRACREGWAPAPTNAVQRKYYDRFVNPSFRLTNDLKTK